MRAIYIEACGGADQLRYGELPTPTPGPGEVLVRVAFAGVNPADWKCREGKLAKYYQYRFPFVLGFEGSGTIEAVGPGVEDLCRSRRLAPISDQIAGVREMILRSSGVLHDCISPAAGAGRRYPCPRPDSVRRWSIWLAIPLMPVCYAYQAYAICHPAGVSADDRYIISGEMQK